VIGSGITSQLLFGETYIVAAVSEDRLWFFVNGHAHAGSGWIPASQHDEISEQIFDQFNQTPFRVTTSVSIIRQKGGNVHLLPGSNIYASSGELFDWRTTIDFNGDSRPFEEKTGRQGVVDIAKTFLHTPYLSGGRSLFGLYEASLFHLVFKIGGYIIPNYLSSLIGHGQETQLEAIQMGDLIVFGNEIGIPHHVGLYLGDGEMMTVNGKVSISRFDPEKKRHGMSDKYSVLYAKNLFLR
jgi:cell wall-associated NlpC family hydrolase